MSTMPTNNPFPGVPNEPFFFGRGGRRMTPEDITRQREFAQMQMLGGADASPVGHWTQGLARALGGLSGGLAMRRVNNAEDANRAEADKVLQALIAGEGGNETILAAAANPYVDNGTREIASLLFKQNNPKATEPPEIIQLATIAEDPAQPAHIREAAAAAVRAKNDPFITFSGPTFGYAGPQSEFATALGGGGQASGAGAGAPATLPPDFFDEPTTQNTPAPELNARGMPASLTRQQYQATVNALGQAATDDWMRRNNIVVTN